MSLWHGCTSRAPPNYDLSPTDFIHFCDPYKFGQHACINPSTGKNDSGLGVVTGNRAPSFSLVNASDPGLQHLVTLEDLTASKPRGLFLQFGSYT